MTDRVVKITAYIPVPDGKEEEVTDAGKENIRAVIFAFIQDAEGVTVEIVDGPTPIEAMKELATPDQFDENGMRKK